MYIDVLFLFCLSRVRVYKTTALCCTTWCGTMSEQNEHLILRRVMVVLLLYLITPSNKTKIFIIYQHAFCFVTCTMYETEKEKKRRRKKRNKRKKEK